MLHPVYMLRQRGIRTEFNAKYAHMGLSDFLATIPEGERCFDDAVRKMAVTLYSHALDTSGKDMFLDKTPRYYLIINELLRIFPKAKFIFLIRNPLAVLASIVDVSLSGDWFRLREPDRRIDVFQAPKLVLDGIACAGANASVVHYEQLVRQPESTVKKLCAYLGIEYVAEMLQYGKAVRFHNTHMVDSKSIYKHDSPVCDYVDTWSDKFDTCQKVAIAEQYLSMLGTKTIKALGYERDNLLEELHARSVAGPRWPSISLSLLTKSTGELTWWNRLYLRTLRLQQDPRYLVRALQRGRR